MKLVKRGTEMEKRKKGTTAATTTTQKRIKIYAKHSLLKGSYLHINIRKL